MEFANWKDKIIVIQLQYNKSNERGNEKWQQYSKQNAKIKEHLEEGKIVIIAGFQGVNENGDITTLGRGGSDTTAVAIAAALGCNCTIYTDVEGIYPIDPNLYPNAKKIDYIGYKEMIEIAFI